MYADGMVAEGPIAEILPPAGSAYAAVAATFPAPERKRLVYELERKIQALSPSVRHLIATGVEPAGSFVENLDLPEATIRELARFTQEQLEVTRLRRWNLALAVLAGIIAILSPI